MGLRLKNFNIMGVHEKPIYSGELPKKDGELREFADLEGGLTKKEGG